MDLKLLTGGWLIFLLIGGQTAYGQTDSTAAGMDRARWQEDSALIRRLADTILTDGRAYDNLRTLTKKVGVPLTSY